MYMDLPPILLFLLIIWHLFYTLFPFLPSKKGPLHLTDRIAFLDGCLDAGCHSPHQSLVQMPLSSQSPPVGLP